MDDVTTNDESRVHRLYPIVGMCKLNCAIIFQLLRNRVNLDCYQINSQTTDDVFLRA